MSRKGAQFKYEKPYFHHQKHAPNEFGMVSIGIYQQEFKDVKMAKNLSKKPKRKK